VALSGLFRRARRMSAVGGKAEIASNGLVAEREAEQRTSMPQERVVRPTGGIKNRGRGSCFYSVTG
jgi:hypothetical protein